MTQFADDWLAGDDGLELRGPLVKYERYFESTEHNEREPLLRVRYHLPLTATPTHTPTHAPTPSPTNTQTNTPSPTPSATNEPTVTPSPNATATNEATNTPTATATMD